MCGLVPLSVLNADLLIANESDMDLLIRQMLNIGEAMYYAGAEISRIEETLYRLGKAYGAEHMNVYAITSSILITMEFREWKRLLKVEESGGMQWTCPN